METTGLALAAHQYVSNLIHNVQFQKPTVLGWMMGMDSYHGEKANPRIQKAPVKGGKMVFNYWGQIPEWDGVDGESEDWSQTEVQITKQDEVFQGSLRPSGYQMAAPISKERLASIEEDAPFRQYIKQLSKRSVEGLIKKLETHLWPAANQVGGTQAYGRTNTRIMSFAYGLQSGYAGNALTGSGTYNYLDIDLNARPEMKALQVGTDSVGWTLSGTALERDLIRPLRTLGANVDTILVDNDCYSALKAELFSTIHQPPADKIKFPGPFFAMDNGTFVVYEPKLDALPLRELYVGDSSTLRFGMLPKGMDSMTLIEDVPKQPSKHLLQGYTRLAFVNERPQFWGRGYKVLLAGD